jgi:hypothetical protein
LADQTDEKLVDETALKVGLRDALMAVRMAALMVVGLAYH